MTANGRPRGATTTPAAPFTSTGRTNGDSPANVSACSATACATVRHERGARTRGAAVGAHHDVWVEHRDERLEVTVARRGEERVDDLALAGDVGIRLGRTPHPSPRPAGELPRRGRSAIHDRGDLVEGDIEHVVEHERQPLGRSQRVEYHLKRQTDGVGKKRLVLGAGPVLGTDDRVRHMREGVLATRRARAKDVQANPRDDRRQPASFSTPLVSDRSNLSQASWTASSASLNDPSIR